MRPKKVILLVDGDQARLEVTRFLLRTHGYNVKGLQDGREAIAFFREHVVDLVLAAVDMKPMKGTALAGQLKEIQACVPVILFGNLNWAETAADAVVDPAACSPAELVQRIKLMAKRKTGPRKGIWKGKSAHISTVST